jgi:hypothetical protein
MKRSFRKLFTGFLLFVFLMALGPGVKASAATLTQTNLAMNSITVSWTEPTNTVTRYTVYVGTGYSDCALYTELAPGQTSVTISGLPAGCERYIRVQYDYVSSYGTPRSDYFLGSAYAVTLPGKVTGLKQDRWWYFIQKFEATWDKQDSVTGYEYVIKNNKGKTVAQAKISRNTNSVDSGKISNAIVYTMQVRAYTTVNGQTYYGDWSDTGYFFTQPRVTKAKVSGSKLTVKWNKVGGATGYDIYVSTSPQSGYKKVKSVSSKTSSVTLSKFGSKKFSSKKKYYVYVATKKKTKTGTYTSGRLYFWNTKSSGFSYFN